MHDLFCILTFVSFAGTILFVTIHELVKSDIRRGVIDKSASKVVGGIKYAAIAILIGSVFMLSQYKETQPKPVKLYVLEDENGIKHSYIKSQKHDGLRCIDDLGQLTPETKVGLQVLTNQYIGDSITSNVIILNDK
jgi:hypothetical protein